MARRSLGTNITIRRQAEAIQKARESLSIEKHLEFLSQVALNGTMPRWNKRGELIEEEPEPVEAKLRIDTAKYIVNKVMSDAAPQPMIANSEDACNAEEIKKLSYQDLRALAFGAIKEAVFRSENEQARTTEGCSAGGVECSEESEAGASPPGTDTQGSA